MMTGDLALPLLRANPPAAMGATMKRFQMDRPIMVKRWRAEWEKHGRDFGNCHCGAGIGTMRKHRPGESHPSSSCGFCATARLYRRWHARQERYAGRLLVAEGLAEPQDAKP